MKLSLIIAPNCSACDRAEAALRNLSTKYAGISLNVIDSNDYDEQSVSIMPALFINDELFSYGEIDESKLLDRYMIKR